MTPSWLNRSMTVLGQRVPVVVVGLVGSILGVSIVAAVSWRAGLPLISLLIFQPDRVLSGEVWRLVTWAFLGTGLNLLFGCYVLWWVGGDLVRAWGGARFLRTCLGVVAVASGLTCLLALVWPDLRVVPYTGVWVLADALTIAWASLTPYGIVQLFFILPVPSRSVPPVLVGLTVIVALLEGVAFYVPHLMAEALMVLYLRDFALRTLWLRMRYATLERKLRRRSSPLREVKREANNPRWFH